MTLLSRLAQAKGPDRELDLASINAGRSEPLWKWHPRMANVAVMEKYGPDAVGNQVVTVPRYTESLDAVLNDWLEGDQGFLVGKHDGAPLSWARLITSGEHGPLVYAATPAIALLIAILRARGIE